MDTIYAQALLSSSNTTARRIPESGLFPKLYQSNYGYGERFTRPNASDRQDGRLAAKAGYEVIFPENMKNLCCGTIWESKGMMDIADRKSAELEAALYKASNGGKYPVLCDQSPCLHRMREVMTQVNYMNQ